MSNQDLQPLYEQDYQLWLDSTINNFK
jgi:hypothetical protein